MIAELQSYFEFARYKTAQDAKSALQARFPKGSDSEALLLYLNQESKYKFHKRPKAYSSGPIGFHAYQIQVPVGNENINAWNILLFIDKDGKVMDSEVRLAYYDENFLLRGIPLRLENAVGAGAESTKKILLDVVGKNITPERVDKVMMDAGADWKTVDKRKGGIVAYIYYYEKGAPRLWSIAYGEKRTEIFSWRFNEKGEFDSLYVIGEKLEGSK